jgi:hypothetical protein
MPIRLPKAVSSSQMKNFLGWNSGTPAEKMAMKTTGAVDQSVVENSTPLDAAAAIVADDKVKPGRSWRALTAAAGWRDMAGNLLFRE